MKRVGKNSCCKLGGYVMFVFLGSTSAEFVGTGLFMIVWGKLSFIKMNMFGERVLFVLPGGFRNNLKNGYSRTLTIYPH